MAALKKHGVTCPPSCVPCAQDRLDSRTNRADRKALLAELKLQQPPLKTWDHGDGKGAKFHKELFREATEIVAECVRPPPCLPPSLSVPALLCCSNPKNCP